MEGIGKEMILNVKLNNLYFTLERADNYRYE
jgi:hypothetical protein